MPLTPEEMETGLQAAIAEAKEGLAEGGLPIGAALMLEGAVIATGRNRRIQGDSQILHAEMAAIENAGRRRDLSQMTLFTTLSPCMMCAGAIVQFGIPEVVIGENRNFGGNEDYLRNQGINVTIADDDECAAMMHDYIAAHPEEWHEDIGE